MMSGTDLRVVIVACVAAICVVQVAGADSDPREAEAEFRRGRELIKVGKTADACRTFEHSLELDFQFGTLYNIAGCEEQLGKLASAWAKYKRVATEDTANTARADLARKRADEIWPRVPKVVVTVAPAVPDLTVFVDNVDVTAQLGSEIPLDLGHHVVLAIAPDYGKEIQDVDLSKEGVVLHPNLHMTKTRGLPPMPPTPIETPQGTGSGAPTPPGVETQPRHPPEPKVTAQRLTTRGKAGKYLMLGGGVVTVVGLASGAYAYASWSDAEDLHAKGDPTANDRVRDARNQASGSTALTIAGVVAVGVGVYLWRTGREEIFVTPSGVAFAGRF
jgi:hypothetical protein